MTGFARIVVRVRMNSSLSKNKFPDRIDTEFCVV